MNERQDQTRQRIHIHIGPRVPELFFQIKTFAKSKLNRSLPQRQGSLGCTPRCFVYKHKTILMLRTQTAQLLSSKEKSIFKVWCFLQRKECGLSTKSLTQISSAASSSYGTLVKMIIFKILFQHFTMLILFKVDIEGGRLGKSFSQQSAWHTNVQ